MALDINKIIRESINETASNEDSNNEIQTIVETETDEAIVVTESVSAETDDGNKMCIASAISAGLGAMTLRNHLRSLNEISDENKARLKTAAKIGAGIAGAGVAAYGAYKYGDDALKGAKKILGIKGDVVGDPKDTSRMAATKTFSDPKDTSRSLTKDIEEFKVKKQQITDDFEKTKKDIMDKNRIDPKDLRGKKYIITQRIDKPPSLN